MSYGVIRRYDRLLIGRVVCVYQLRLIISVLFISFLRVDFAKFIHSDDFAFRVTRTTISFVFIGEAPNS